MKKTILLIVLLPLFISAQSKFSKGYQDGYKEGYCYDRDTGCIEPIPPIPPIPGINESLDSYQDGYNRGFTEGKGSSNNSNRERYKTDSPEYIDYVYKGSSTDKVNELLAVKQREYDNVLAMANQLFAMLDIKYIDSEQERENVKELKYFWEGFIVDVMNQVRKDPGNATSYLPQIQKLQREIMADRQTGYISKIEGSYYALQQWMKDNEDLKKTNPHTYNSKLENAMKEWGGNSITGNIWGENKNSDSRKQNVVSYAPILDKPDMSNGKTIGKAENNTVIVLEKVDENYYKVKSGTVTGYIWVGWFK